MRLAKLICLIVCVCPTGATAKPVSIWALTTNGETQTCATVFDPASGVGFNDGEKQWILGYFSGLNAGSGLDVANQSDANGIIGEVRLYCEAHPSALLPDAVLNTWRKLKGARR
jgi:hypothetical protein